MRLMIDKLIEEALFLSGGSFPRTSMMSGGSQTRITIATVPMMIGVAMVFLPYFISGGFEHRREKRDGWLTTNHRFDDDERNQYLVYARLDLLYMLTKLCC